MHLSTSIAALFVASALAQAPTGGFQIPGFKPSATFQFLSKHPYITPGSVKPGGEGVVRSPCPLLNTIANHGFLPRDGKNITVSQFVTALTDSVNLSPDFGKTLAAAAFQKLNIPDTSSINLDQLNAHGTLEHDASLSRLDKIQGDTAAVQPARVRDLLNDIQPPTYQYVNATSLGRSRARVEKASVDAGSPSLSAQDQTTAKGEAALILLVLGKNLDNSSDLDARSIDKDILSQFFLNERFNVERGWVKSEKQFDLAADMLPLIGKINEHQIQATAPPEFKPPTLPSISLPSISLPTLSLPTLSGLPTLLGLRFRA